MLLTHGAGLYTNSRVEQIGLFSLVVGGVVVGYSSGKSRRRRDSAVVVISVCKYSGDQSICQITTVLIRFI